MYKNRGSGCDAENRVTREVERNLVWCVETWGRLPAMSESDELQKVV